FRDGDHGQGLEQDGRLAARYGRELGEQIVRQLGPAREGDVGREQLARLVVHALVDRRRKGCDRGHGRHPEREADHGEEQAPALAARVAGELGEEEAGRHDAWTRRSSFSIRPSRKWTERSAKAATSGSWVTRTMVEPASRRSSSRRSRTLAPVAL